VQACASAAMIERRGICLWPPAARRDMARSPRGAPDHLATALEAQPPDICIPAASLAAGGSQQPRLRTLGDGVEPCALSGRCSTSGPWRGLRRRRGLAYPSGVSRPMPQPQSGLSAVCSGGWSLTSSIAYFPPTVERLRHGMGSGYHAAHPGIKGPSEHAALRGRRAPPSLPCSS